jgi:hypothetical protein
MGSEPHTEEDLEKGISAFRSDINTEEREKKCSSSHSS